MNLPKIDIASLPDLDKLTGLFGSLHDVSRAVSSNDTLTMIMVFVYENTGGGSFTGV